MPCVNFHQTARASNSINSWTFKVQESHAEFQSRLSWSPNCHRYWKDVLQHHRPIAGCECTFAAAELEKQTRQSTPKLWRSRTLVSPRGWSFCKSVFKFLSILHARIRKVLYSESLKRAVRAPFKMERSVACSFRRLNGFYHHFSYQIRLDW